MQLIKGKVFKELSVPGNILTSLIVLEHKRIMTMLQQSSTARAGQTVKMRILPHDGGMTLIDRKT